MVLVAVDNTISLISSSSLTAPARAAEVDCDSIYCFTPEDFGDSLTGICITDLPKAEGILTLGSRILQPGDILTAEQVAQMTFHPLGTETDRETAVGYLPIYENHVAEESRMTLSILGKEDKAPAAEDLAVRCNHGRQRLQYREIPAPAADR